MTFVDQLSPIYRRVVYLFYFHGLNTADASDALGIPVPTFKAHLMRARKHLRNRINELVHLKSLLVPLPSLRETSPRGYADENGSSAGGADFCPPFSGSMR